MNVLLIIDGSSMLTTNYFGTLPPEILYAKTQEEREKHYDKIMRASNGKYTNAVFSTLKQILKIMEEQQPSHIAVVFDRSRNTFRRQLYPDYKGTRKETDAPLKEQFATMGTVLNRIGIQTFSSFDYEADDYAGTLAYKFCEELPIRLMTKDQDYLQLASKSKNISVWLGQSTQDKTDKLYAKYNVNKLNSNIPERFFEYTEDVIKEEYGIPNAKAIIDMKAIGGDSSDNIPGVKGVSCQGVAPLLCIHGTVEGLYHDMELIGPAIEDTWKVQYGIRKGIYKKLNATDAKNMALLSKQLATIKTDIPIECSLHDLSTSCDFAELAKICDEYDFRSIKTKYLSSEIRR